MRIETLKSEIERQMTEMGMSFQFSGVSTTNGISIYYNVDGKKFRFSDHSVTNIERINNEEHYDLPLKSTLTLKGIVRKHINVFTKEVIWMQVV